MRFLLICCLAAACPALAQNVPDPVYFAGRYAVIGRDAKGAINDVMQLHMRGDQIEVVSCTQGTGRMVLDRGGEGSFAAIKVGTWDLDCQWFNTWDNYPLLACHDDGVARMTLWPETAPLGCGAE